MTVDIWLRMAGVLLLVVVVSRRHWRWAARIRSLFAVPGSSVDLAVTRIVFFTVALVSSNGEEAARLAALPASLRTYPVGSSLIYDLLDPSPQLARVGAGAMVVCATFATVGLWTRAAGLTWVLLATYVNGIPQLFGKVDHGHHLVWFGLILALSPCADALSVDAWRRRISPRVDVRYGLPIRLWWLLLGLVYFFPGLWKIVTGGVHWVSPESIRSHLFAVWAGLEDFAPVVPVHRWPAALVALGVFTIVFELGFVVAVFTRARWAWAAMGVAFHVGTLLIMNIQFSSLIVCYVALVPWSRLLVLEAGSGPVARGTGMARMLDSAGTGAVLMLVAAVAAFGSLRLVDAWPVSAYPLFDSRQGPLYATLSIVGYGPEGSVEISLDDAFGWVPPSRRLPLIRRFGQLEPADRTETIRRSLADGTLDGLSKLEVVEEWRRTDPDASDAAIRSVLVYTVDLVASPGALESQAGSTDAAVMLVDDDR